VRVTAVIVHWQDADDTRGCVASVAAEPGVDVLVVDNGSREPLGDTLAGRATVVRSGENLGYAGGANLGIRHALDGGADVVLLLNNDVRLRQGATAIALATLAGDAGIAVVGPKVLAREDPSRLWLAWGERDVRAEPRRAARRRRTGRPGVERRARRRLDRGLHDVDPARGDRGGRTSSTRRSSRTTRRSTGVRGPAPRAGASSTGRTRS
jgi:GT2 family glycosyltransferase